MSKLPRRFYRDGLSDHGGRNAGFHRELQLTASEDHRAFTRGKRQKRALMRNSNFDYSRWVESYSSHIQRSWKHRAKKRKQWNAHRLSRYEYALLDTTQRKQHISL